MQRQIVPVEIALPLAISKAIIPYNKGLRCEVTVKNTGTVGIEVWAWFGLGKIIEPWQDYRWQPKLDFGPKDSWLEPGKEIVIDTTYPATPLHSYHQGTWDVILDIDSVSQVGRSRVNEEGYLLTYWSSLVFWWGYSQVEIQ